MISIDLTFDSFEGCCSVETTPAMIHTAGLLDEAQTMAMSSTSSGYTMNDFRNFVTAGHAIEVSLKDAGVCLSQKLGIYFNLCSPRLVVRE